MQYDWNQIPYSFNQNLAESMPERVKNFIKNKERWTKYGTCETEKIKYLLSFDTVYIIDLLKNHLQ